MALLPNVEAARIARGRQVEDQQTLLRRFVDHGALSEPSALSLAGIGRELSDRTAERMRRAGWLGQTRIGRYWVRPAGLHALAAYEDGRVAGPARVSGRIASHRESNHVQA